MELDTAASRNAISARPGSLLHALRRDGRGFSRYAEYFEESEQVRPALQRKWRKVERAKAGFINRARATTVRFSSRHT